MIAPELVERIAAAESGRETRGLSACYRMTSLMSHLNGIALLSRAQTKVFRFIPPIRMNFSRMRRPIFLANRLKKKH